MMLLPVLLSSLITLPLFIHISCVYYSHMSAKRGEGEKRQDKWSPRPLFFLSPLLLAWVAGWLPRFGIPHHINEYET